MYINIKATNTTLTPAIRAAVEDKLSVLDRFLQPEDKIHVEVEYDLKHAGSGAYRAEVHIQPHGQYADVHGNDFYEALDLVIPKIKEQLVKPKDKRVSLRRRLGSIFKR